MIQDKLIEYYGYEAEAHNVTTEDGYKYGGNLNVKQTEKRFNYIFIDIILVIAWMGVFPRSCSMNKLAESVCASRTVLPFKSHHHFRADCESKEFLSI